jgi:large subunit ribosomal protein L11
MKPSSSGNKKLVGSFKLVVQAGKANPAPPIGPALGQKGLNIMEFCKQFNALTAQMEGPIPALITYYSDKSFTIETKTPPASYLIKKAIGLQSGSKEAGKVSVGSIKTSQLQKIAETKMQDMSASSVDAAIRTLSGTATSIGIDVEDDLKVLN